jgi:hypothetical protein
MLGCQRKIILISILRFKYSLKDVELSIISSITPSHHLLTLLSIRLRAILPIGVGRFLDNEITAELSDYHIPGAAVSVVKDGQLFFAKGTDTLTCKQQAQA